MKKKSGHTFQNCHFNPVDRSLDNLVTGNKITFQFFLKGVGSMNDWTLCIAVETSKGTLKTQTLFTDKIVEMVKLNSTLNEMKTHKTKISFQTVFTENIVRLGDNQTRSVGV